MIIQFLKIPNYNQNIKSTFLFNLISNLSFQGIYSVFTGIYIKNLGFGETIVGHILSMNSLSIATGAIFVPFLIKKIGTKKTLNLGFLLLALGFLGLSFSKTILFLYLFSFFIGMGYSFPSICSGVILSDNTDPEEKIEVFSSNFVIQCLGIVSGSYFSGTLAKIFGLFMSEKLVVPSLFALTSLFCLLSFIPLSNITDIKKEKTLSKNLYLDLKSIFSGKSLGFIFYNTIIGFGAGLVIPFFSIYLKFALNIDNANVAKIMSISQLGLVIGGLIVPYISKKLGNETTIILCQLLSIPFLISIAFPQGIALVAISFLLRSTLMNLNQPLIQNISMNTVDSELKPLMGSIISISSNLTRAISVIIGGFMMENISYNFPYYFTVVFYLLSTFIFWYYFKRDPKKSKNKFFSIK